MARNFNGSSDIIDTPAQQWPQNAMALCAHINPTSVTVGQLIASMYQGSPSTPSAAYCQFGILNPGILFSRIQLLIDNIYIERDSNSSVISAGSWQHVAMTWNGGTANTAISSYLNGIQIDTTNNGLGVFTGPYTGNGVQFFIGAQRSGPPQSVFGGPLADVVLYNVALTQAEIIALARGARPNRIRPQSIVRWYPLDGYNHPALDRSFQKANGVLTGTKLLPGPPLLNPAPILLSLPDPSVVMPAVRIPPVPPPPPPGGWAEIDW